jgi:hypothetical protein
MNNLNKLVDILIVNFDILLKPENQLSYDNVSSLSLIKMLVVALQQQLLVDVPETKSIIKDIMEIVFLDFEEIKKDIKNCISPNQVDAACALIWIIKCKIERIK